MESTVFRAKSKTVKSEQLKKARMTTSRLTVLTHLMSFPWKAEMAPNCRSLVAPRKRPLAVARTILEGEKRQAASEM